MAVSEAGQVRERSELLRYLPNIYADHPFMERLLCIFEQVWGPIVRQIDYLYAYFDPNLTPADFLPWLGYWVDVILDENWPEERQRELISRAADLYRRGGTPAGLRDYLSIYLGTAPDIIEDGTDENPYHFTVVVHGRNPDQLDMMRLKRMIDNQKPAHTTYSLRVEAEE